MKIAIFGDKMTVKWLKNTRNHAVIFASPRLQNILLRQWIIFYIFKQADKGRYLRKIRRFPSIFSGPIIVRRGKVSESFFTLLILNAALA